LIHEVLAIARAAAPSSLVSIKPSTTPGTSPALARRRCFVGLNCGHGVSSRPAGCEYTGWPRSRALLDAAPVSPLMPVKPQPAASRMGGLGPGLRRDDVGASVAFTNSGAIPALSGRAYDRAAPLTEGCSMEASRSESGAAAGSRSRKPRQQGSPSRPRVKLPVPSELKRDA
jgi:hypothetical protein